MVENLFDESQLTFEDCLNRVGEVVATQDLQGSQLYMFLLYARLYAERLGSRISKSAVQRVGGALLEAARTTRPEGQALQEMARLLEALCRHDRFLC